MKKNKFLVKGEDSFLSVSVTLHELKLSVVCKPVQVLLMPLRSSAPPLVGHNQLFPLDTPCVTLCYVPYRFKSFCEK